MRVLRQGGRPGFRGDLFGGLTAAVVALPLALAFGVSSGAGPEAGLYGAICVGFFAALFGGTPTQISGPTGPMTVVMAAIFTQYSSSDPANGPVLAFTVVMMAGLIQIMLGLLKLGRYITLVPFPVISGFMSGIGVIIILLQLGPLLGFSAPSSVLGALSVLPAQLIHFNPLATMLGLLSLGLILFCPQSLGRMIPPALLALICSTLIYSSLGSDQTLPVIGAISPQLPQWGWPQIDISLLGDMVLSAMVLAVLGAIDSLLTSLVADNLTRSEHDSERELIGQGVGNLLAGFAGGLPGAGATMRTVVNIRAGGQTRLSGMIHALFLLSVLAGAGALAENVPHAVLAGILIKVGIDIIDWRFLQRAPGAPRVVVALMLVVLVITVFYDLISAVLIGVFLANVITVKRLADAQLDATQVLDNDVRLHQDLSVQESRLLQEAGGEVLLYMLRGPVSYAAAKGLKRKLSVYSHYQCLIFDFSAVPLLDVSTALAIEDMLHEALQSDRNVYFSGMNKDVEEVFQRMNILVSIPAGNHTSQREAALEQAVLDCQDRQVHSGAR